MLVFPLIVVAISAVICRSITRSWLSPGAFFSICWAFFLIVPVIFASDYKINVLGPWFISIFTMALVSGSLIAYRPFFEIEKDIDHILIQEDYKILNYVFLFFSSTSFVGIILLFQYASNIYISDYYNANWMTIPNFIAVDRYSNDLDYPYIIKYSLYFIYPANLLGGLLFGRSQLSNKLKFLFLIPLFEAVTLGIIEGARTSILLGLILFISAWLSTLVFQSPRKNNNKPYIKIVSMLIIILGSFTFIFVFIQWLRQGMDTIVVDLLIDRIRAYFFGYLAAFSQWISSEKDLNVFSGLITFAGPFNLSGIMERPLGFYESVFIGNGVTTNIFTAFRGLVIDFTIPGSFIIAFLIGFISQIFFQNKSKIKLLNTLPISMFYAFTLYSPLISIFHYNSILFSWIIVSIPLIYSKNESVAYNS